MPSHLEQRILEISHKHHLSHVGSCLLASEPIKAAYKLKKDNEPFILSNGHAGLALYCVLEEWGFGDAEEMWKKHGTHPNRDMEHGIWASTGSLGHGIGIAVGMALSDRDRLVYVFISDGECAEGSVWEALRIAGEQRLENLRLAIICNGYGAYGKIEVDILERRLEMFYPNVVIKCNLFNYPDWFQGQEGHYHVLTDENMRELNL